MICLTEDIYVDELENEERGIAETFLDDSVLASRARPGTSLAKPATSARLSTSQAVRYAVPIYSKFVIFDQVSVYLK